MSYNKLLAERVRNYLITVPGITVEEKKMFGGLAFMINEKMCINVSGDSLMCRFDPQRTEEVSHLTGYEKMVMKGRTYKGFCYVHPEGYEHDTDFKFWLELCLEFNDRAKSSKK